MKDAYVRVKDKAEHGYYSAESSPEEYATDRTSTFSDSALHEAGHQLDKQGRKAVKETKENISKAKDYFKQKKAEQPIQRAREQAKRAARSAGKTMEQAAGRIVQRESLPLRTRTRAKPAFPMCQTASPIRSIPWPTPRKFPIRWLKRWAGAVTETNNMWLMCCVITPMAVPSVWVLLIRPLWSCHCRRSGSKADSPTDPGTALATAWSGVPAL